ncbi:uncharacterized protein EI97DRAFT_498619 [Westerdykella ornata]|uniref:Heterokaryon incompatibility domain-containing protein n=1 Tax=Westerdykella ornata TaxID=318751 RepID=A0A6A6JW39_WESOR|nr:uncharacterized protein EI97DRAFT_498619 [Westerdykella ornata]KAF2280445.1 hypothetical protein EI97DRAFT_498619 [Westerdykella ornata]
MWLINAHTYELVDVGSRLERYAILSHTWGPEEVSFQEYQAGSARHKSGYRKIVSTCHRAQEDGYDYVWVDTCCIDKTSSAVLSESINSMFKWYQDAAMCYAFLEDVEGHDDFPNARWHTRGWTLQELLAPREVEFYNSKWQHMGTRRDLAGPIQSVTGIDRRALQGNGSIVYVRAASIATKMAWAAGRETTRDEDIAYSLLGIFDVNMPLLYGEGGSKAFQRLQEEIIKRNLDQTFLAWTLPSGDTGEPTDLLASSPECFARSNCISTINEDLAPFSLNNQGLQIRLPIFRARGKRNSYVAVLSCVKDHPTSRIGVRLRAIDRNAKVLVRQGVSRLRLVTEAEYDSATIRDCSLLRSVLAGNRRFMIVRFPGYAGFRHLQWRQMVYLDPSDHWHYMATEMERFELTPFRAGDTLSYGIIFTEPSEEQYSNTTHTPAEPEPQRRRSFQKVSKILVRVDIDVGSPYAATVSIQRFRDTTRNRLSVNAIPTTHMDVSAGRDATIQIGPQRTRWGPAESRSRSRPFQYVLRLLPHWYLDILALLLPLHKRPKTLRTKLSWERHAGQDNLVVDIGVIQPSVWRWVMDISFPHAFIIYFLPLYCATRVTIVLFPPTADASMPKSSFLTLYIGLVLSIVTLCLGLNMGSSGVLLFLLGAATLNLVPTKLDRPALFLGVNLIASLLKPEKRETLLDLLQVGVTILFIVIGSGSLVLWMSSVFTSCYRKAQQHAPPSTIMTSPPLTSAQTHALFDILIHHQLYAEIEAFKYPQAISTYGYPFRKNDGVQTTSPLLQNMLNKFVLRLPGLRNVGVDFWQDKVKVLVEKLGDAELSESYDKGAIGARKAMATAISSMLDLASLLHHVFIMSPDGQYILRLIENVHRLVPYYLVKQTLRVGNAATMINGMVKLVLTKVSFTAVTNWMGITNNANDGMNLMQQIISTVMAWDTAEFQRRAQKLESQRDAPEKKVFKAIRNYVYASRDTHEAGRNISIRESKSIICVILETSDPHIDPDTLTAHHHDLAMEHYSTMLSIRDREELTKILCKMQPDLLTSAIRDLVSAFEPIIRAVHNAVDLSGTVTDAENFIDDLIKVSKPKKLNSANGPGSKTSSANNSRSSSPGPVPLDGSASAADSSHLSPSSMPTVEDYVQLLRKHVPSAHKFFHQVAKNAPDLANQYLEYAKSCVGEFRTHGSGNEGHASGGAGDMTGPLHSLFSSLPTEKQEQLKPLLDKHAKHLEQLTRTSRSRLKTLVRTTTQPTSSQPNEQSHRKHYGTTHGPGIYLSRWHALLDSTLISPGSMRGPVRHGYEVNGELDGKGLKVDTLLPSRHKKRAPSRQRRNSLDGAGDEAERMERRRDGREGEKMEEVWYGMRDGWIGVCKGLEVMGPDEYCSKEKRRFDDSDSIN